MSQKSIEFTEPHRIGVPRGSAILVALSGGADSSALLHLLVEYGKQSGAKISAAHVNHGIRGAEYGFEADRDEEFCKNFCKHLGVELFVKKLDIPTLARKSGRSLETEAREARYSFFAEIMQRENIDFLATAHNADDNIETQLFNLCRGCGIDGMIGIPESRGLGEDKKTVIRPLLKAAKCDIIAYCKQHGIDFVTDSTNLETNCTRNEIRHRIIPTLTEIFPAAKKSAQRLSVSALEDSDFIFKEAERFLRDNSDLEVGKLKDLHPALLKRVLLLAFASVSEASLEAVHLDALVSLLSNSKNGVRLSLPDKKQAAVIDGLLIFSNESRTSNENTAPYFQKLSLGINIIENTDFAVGVANHGCANENIPDGYSLYAHANLRLDCADSLFAKNREQGDTILDCKVNKKIKKLMCDKKVALRDRDTLPLICMSDSVIYVPLCALGDTVKTRRGEIPNYTLCVYKRSEAK